MNITTVLITSTTAVFPAIIIIIVVVGRIRFFGFRFTNHKVTQQQRSLGDDTQAHRIIHHESRLGCCGCCCWGSVIRISDDTNHVVVENNLPDCKFSGSRIESRRGTQTFVLGVLGYF
jgi:hypothetical protein